MDTWDQQLPDSGLGSTPGPIAIVGIGCRFPGGANTPSEFWSLLKNKTCAITAVPRDRWNAEQFFSPEPDAPFRSISKWAGFTDDLWGFDAEFFGISPREAEAMDPQQRMLLTVSWEAFEDAGIAPDRLAGSNAGVFIGISTTDYQAVQAKINPDTDLSHSASGTALSVAANRISNRFDFQGPSLAVDTACSSSLYATEIACRNLWSGDCDVAVAGGVNALVLPQTFINFSKARMLSPTGQVFTFDARANGFVRAEGAGAVILKRLDDAIADNDRIYAVIASATTNQDGYTATLTVPSADAQIKMLKHVCQGAGIEPDEVSYVEAHGTGTPVGDPIEAAAIGSVFGMARRDGKPIKVGSVKTNIGHLEAAAGIGGLIKAALVVHHKEIPGHPNFERANPNIPINILNLDIPTEHQAWNPNGPRRAVVNSFGFGGANASVVVEEAPKRTQATVAGSNRLEIPSASANRWIVPLSAATDSALKRVAGNVADTVASDRSIELADIVGTLALRRAHLTSRTGVVARSRADLIRKLRAIEKDETADYQDHMPPSIVAGQSREFSPKVCFVFSGQGSQWRGMALQLLQHDRQFAAAVEEVDKEIQSVAGWSILEELRKPATTSRIDQTRITQACIFAVQVGLNARWRAWGIRPNLILGHSLGEVAAAYSCGALTLSDAVKLVHFRSLYQAETEGKGAIVSLGLSFEDVVGQLADFGDPAVEIAAVNSSQMTSIAGERTSVDRFLRKLRRSLGSDLFIRRIRMNFAPHSPQMEAIKAPFVESLRNIRPRASAIPMISTVSGEAIAGEGLNANYWWRNIRAPVRFQDAIQTALEMATDIFIEIGPDAPLTGLVGSLLGESGSKSIVVPSLRRRKPDADTLYAGLAKAWTAGVKPDWRSVTGSPARFVELPLYPWETRRFVLDEDAFEDNLIRPTDHPLLGERLSEAMPSWLCGLRIENVRFLEDHVVDDLTLMPATAYMEMFLAVGRQLFGDGPLEVENFEIVTGIPLQKGKTTFVSTTFDPERHRVTIHARPNNRGAEWTLRAVATVTQRPLTSPAKRKMPTDLSSFESFSKRAFYKKAAEMAFHFGPSFQSLSKAWCGETTTISTVNARQDQGPYTFHPANMDATCGQPMVLLAGEDNDDGGEDKLYLPKSIERARLYRSPTKRMHSFGERTAKTDLFVTWNQLITDSDGNPVFELSNARSTNVLAGRGTVSEHSTGVQFGREDWIVAPLEGDDVSEFAPGAWIIFADQAGIGDRFRRHLESRRNNAILVRPGPAYRFGGGTAVVELGDPDGYEKLLSDVMALGKPIAGIAFLWGVDLTRSKGRMSPSRLTAAQEASTIAALHVTQALAAKNWPTSVMLVATAGALPVPTKKPSANNLLLAPLAGFARSVRTEYPGFDCRTVDLDPRRMDEEAADLIASEIMAAGEQPEEEVAYRGGQRHVPRYIVENGQALPPRTLAGSALRSNQAFHVTMNTAGDTRDLIVREAERPEPGPDDVLIDVKAVGLNFRDVMAATGLLPLEAEELPAWLNLGLEYAGVVQKIGAQVRKLKVGDRVFGYGRGCLRSHLVKSEREVRRIPRSLSFAEAAAIPIAFLTAYHGLVSLGRLAKGERVLIHVATGGVGLAAIQIARMVGADILATAGSPKKRALLKMMGIKTVMDSRSLTFADEVMAATDGRGVDIVLNSLAGAAIDKGLAVLAPGGRFLEIGKMDIYLDRGIGLRALRRNIGLFVIDVASLVLDDPDAVTATFDQIEKHFRNGKLGPLPIEEFSVEKSREAFDHMASARHIGKVVIGLDSDRLKVAVDSTRPVRFERDATYLVTGGLAGLGLTIALWLAAHGAGHIVLCSRTGVPDDAAKAAIAEMEARGARVTTLPTDATDLDAVNRLIDTATEGGMALRGVFHAAGVIDDALIPDLSDHRMQAVMAPKLLGAWNLHQATQGHPLDHFVLCSSIASIFGNAGQANYVAGNAFMDALASFRQSKGLPALSVNWGALGGIGMVARNKELKAYMETSGIRPIMPANVQMALGIMAQKAPCQIACIDIDWSDYSRVNSGVMRQRRFSEVSVEGKTGSGAARREILNAPLAKRQEKAVGYLRNLVASVLKVDASKIDPEESLRRLGLDSLSAFQLKNRVEADYSIILDISNVLQNPTVEKLALALVTAIESTDTQDDDGSGESRGENKLSVQQTHILDVADRCDASSAYLQSYQVAGACTISPRIDTTIAGQAMDQLLRENPILRAHFPMRDGQRVLKTLDEGAFGLETFDCTGMSEADFQATLEKAADEPLDLENGPLCRAQVYHRPDDVDLLVVRGHTIIIDGASVLLIFRNLLDQIAPERVAGTLAAEILDGPSMKYSAFVEAQRQFLKSPKGRTQLHYWHKQLEGLGPQLSLPYDFDAPEDGSRQRGTTHFVLDGATTGATARLAHKLETTSFAILMSVYALVLSRYSGQSDIPITTAAGGRTRPSFENILGPVGNPLIIRARMDAGDSFSGALAKLDETIRDGLTYQDYPFPELSKAMEVDPNWAGSAADQVSFSMYLPGNLQYSEIALMLLDFPDVRLDFGGMRIETKEVKRSGCRRDLSCYLQENQGRCYFHVEFDANRFMRSRIDRFIRDYLATLEAVLENPDAPVAALLATAYEETAG